MCALYYLTLYDPTLTSLCICSSVLCIGLQGRSCIFFVITSLMLQHSSKPWPVSVCFSQEQLYIISKVCAKLKSNWLHANIRVIYKSVLDEDNPPSCVNTCKSVSQSTRTVLGNRCMTVTKTDYKSNGNEALQKPEPVSVYRILLCNLDDSYWLSTRRSASRFSNSISSHTRRTS